MGGGGRPGAVDGLGGDLDGGVAAEGHVGAPDVVIDRLGKGDDVQPLGGKKVGGLGAAVAAQHDQAVEL